MTNQSIGFLAKKFLQMEEENNLFELENEEEICIWDIFRYVVYIRILSLHGIMPNALNFRRYEFSDIKSYLRIIKIVYKTGLNRVLSIRRLKSECDTVIFSLSRFLTDDLNPVDHLLNNYIKATTEDKMLIELFNSKKFSFLKGNHEGRYFPHEIQLGYIFCKRSELDFLEISKIINSTFGINVGWNEWLNEIYHRFNVEKKVYQNIFTKVKAKKVLFQGPSKSIVAAANSVGAVTIDVLHGQVNRLGIAYWYSDKIEYANFLTIPDYLLTMGEYWNSQVSMPSKVFCVGNDYFFSPIRIDMLNNKRRCMFVSASFIDKEMRCFAKEFAKKFEDYEVIYKLHPNQFDDIEAIKFFFEKCKNVHVVYTERTSDDILKECSFVVVVNSTIAYQALQMGLNVFILKTLYYEIGYDIVEFDAVNVVSNISEMSGLINGRNLLPTDEGVIFFEKFNKDCFIKLIEEVHC